MPFKFMSSKSPAIAFSKDAFLNRRRSSPIGSNHSACQSEPRIRTGSGMTIFRETVCCVSLQAQYQAFVRFAVESSTALAIALDWTCVLEPFTRRALVSRTLASTRYYLRGQQPWTDVVGGT